MKRIWHPFTEWEDVEMWTPCSQKERKALVEKAVVFTGNDCLYGHWMHQVLTAFPKACEHNLTDLSMNRRAWIGHAACFLATVCSEDVTREAWGLLTDHQRDLANLQADAAIAAWEKHHEAKNTGLDREVGRQGVFQWDT